MELYVYMISNTENQITDTLIHESIDWDNVNATVKKWKKYSMDFLINNLR